MVLASGLASDPDIHHVDTKDMMRLNAGAILNQLPNNVMLQRHSYKIVYVVPFPDMSVTLSDLLHDHIHDSNCSSLDFSNATSDEFTGDNILSFGNDNMENLCSKIRETSDLLVRDVVAFGDNLGYVIRTIKTITHHFNSTKFTANQQKRGLSFVGEFLDTAFGLAGPKTVDALKMHIHYLEEGLKNSKAFERKLFESHRFHVKLNNDRHFNMIRRLQDYTKSVHSDFVLMAEADKFNFYNMFELFKKLRRVSYYISESLAFEDKWLACISAFSENRLCPTLIKPKRLKSLVQMINTRLELSNLKVAFGTDVPFSVLYNELEVTYTHSETKLYAELSVPLVDTHTELFDLYAINTFPISISNNSLVTTQLQNVPDLIAISNLYMFPLSYSDFGKCHGKRYLVCDGVLQITNISTPSCVQSLIQNDVQGIAKMCQYKLETFKFKPLLKYKQFFILSHAVQSFVHCGDDAEILECNHICLISLKCDCHISNQWQRLFSDMLFCEAKRETVTLHTFNLPFVSKVLKITEGLNADSMYMAPEFHFPVENDLLNDMEKSAEGQMLLEDAIAIHSDFRSEPIVSNNFVSDLLIIISLIFSFVLLIAFMYVIYRLRCVLVLLAALQQSVPTTDGMRIYLQPEVSNKSHVEQYEMLSAEIVSSESNQWHVVLITVFLAILVVSLMSYIIRHISRRRYLNSVKFDLLIFSKEHYQVVNLMEAKWDLQTLGVQGQMCMERLHFERNFYVRPYIDLFYDTTSLSLNEVPICLPDRVYVSLIQYFWLRKITSQAHNVILLLSIRGVLLGYFGSKTLENPSVTLPIGVYKIFQSLTKESSLERQISIRRSTRQDRE